MQNLGERSIRIPLVEHPPSRLPRAELFGQVAPWRAGTQHPQDAVEDRPRVAPRPTRLRRSRENVGNQFPFFIRQTQASHRHALHDRKSNYSPSIADAPKTSNISFETEPKRKRL